MICTPFEYAGLAIAGQGFLAVIAHRRARKPFLGGEMDRIPESLLTQLQQGRVVIFVGAGLSVGAGAPTWKALLQELIELAAREQLLDESDGLELRKLLNSATENYLVVAEYLKLALAEKMSEEIRGRFLSLPVQQTHLLLTELGLPGIVTTNFDNLIEEAFLRATGKPIPVIEPANSFALARIDDEHPWLLKIHGTADNPDTVVLTASDFERLPVAVLKALEHIFERYTVLFVGYSLKDPDTVRLLSALRQVYSGSNRRHYMLTEASTTGRVTSWYLRDKLKVQEIPYDNVSGNHSEVEDFLEILSASKKRHGAARMSKALLLVIGEEVHDDGQSNRVILVSDSNPQWVSASGSSHGMQGAFLLPSINVSDSTVDVTDLTAAFLGYEPSSLDLIVDPDLFVSKKFNPALERETIYEFRFIQLKSGPRDFQRESVEIAGRTYVWRSLMDLRAHPPTMDLNKDVILELCNRYGSGLEGASLSIQIPLLRYRDPYAVRSRWYDSLPWVSGEEFHKQLFNELEEAPIGVVELGCGPAAMAPYVCESLGVPYIGIEHSHYMVQKALARVAGLPLATIIEDNIITAEPVNKFDGFTFLLKNTLHLIDSPHKLLSSLSDRIGKSRELMIVETVSPSPRALAWIQALFSEARLTYKRNWFVSGHISHVATTAGWTVLKESEFGQMIDVEAWLKSFELDTSSFESALNLINNAPAGVREEMRIEYNDNCVLQMLRLQSISVVVLE
jgi:hypothetical protein